MGRRWPGLLAGFCLLLGCAGTGDPQGSGDTALQGAAPTAGTNLTLSEPLATRPRLIVYRPRLASRADVRVQPGDRAGTVGAYLTVLAPAHTGFATTLQPTLYWYVESPPGPELVLTLTALDAVEPLLETRLSPAVAGIQSLSLAEQGVRLEPGIEYEWHVALVVDPEHRSRDLLGTGAVQVLGGAGAPPAGAAALERAVWYADNGFWYDALAVLQDAIEQNDALAREARDELLAQVALTGVADRL